MPLKTSRGESSRRNAIRHTGNGCGPLPWYHHGLRERSLQDRKTKPDTEGVALSAHGVTMGRDYLNRKQRNFKKRKQGVPRFRWDKLRCS